MSAASAALRFRAQSPTLYRDCLALSLAVHALMFAAIGHRGASAPLPPTGPVEVDLTKLLAGGPAKLGAPKALTKAPQWIAYLDSRRAMERTRADMEKFVEAMKQLDQDLP